MDIDAIAPPGGLVATAIMIDIISDPMALIRYEVEDGSITLDGLAIVPYKSATDVPRLDRLALDPDVLEAKVVEMMCGAKRVVLPDVAAAADAIADWASENDVYDITTIASDVEEEANVDAAIRQGASRVVKSRHVPSGIMLFCGPADYNGVLFHQEPTDQLGLVVVTHSILHVRLSPADLSMFPHKCPKCSAPAYVGFSKVECSRRCGYNP
jgi:hypothetical protein